MIRIDALWLAAQPVDMRAGADRLLALVLGLPWQRLEQTRVISRM